MAGPEHDPLAVTGISTDLADLIALRAYLGRGEQERQRTISPNPGTQYGKRKDSGLEFEDLRPYVVGDDVRHIDWNATARTGETHVKLFRESREHLTLIAVDLRASMFFGTRRALRSVAACEFAALIAWHAAERGGRVGGLIITDKGDEAVRPHAGRKAPVPLLGQLHATHSHCLRNRHQFMPRRLQQIMAPLTHLARRGGAIVVVSSFDDPGSGFVEGLAAVERHADCLLVRVADPLERVPPPPGAYGILSPEGRRRQVVIGEGDQLSAVRVLETEDLRVETMLQDTGARVMKVSTDEEPWKAMHRYLKIVER